MVKLSAPVSRTRLFSDEPDVGGPFTEPAHEVRKPLLAERHVDPNGMALARERRLQIAADAVQHLELDSDRAPMPRSAANGLRGLDHASSCVAMAG